MNVPSSDATQKLGMALAQQTSSVLRPVNGRISDTLKKGLRAWTLSMAGGDLDRRLEGSRPQNEYGVDPWGYSLDYALSALGPFLWLYKNYFRVDTYGIEKVPAGRVLLISNHSGQLPVDGAMIGVAMLTEAKPPRPIRSMKLKLNGRRMAPIRSGFAMPKVDRLRCKPESRPR